jgi:RHS repeat-associated protein
VEENSNTQRTPYLFTAKELDEETGLYYFGARYYDPRTSVWQSADPVLGKYLPNNREPVQLTLPSHSNQWQTAFKLPGVGGVFNAQNLAVYSYAHLNPVRYLDPNGEFTSPTDSLEIRNDKAGKGHYGAPRPAHPTGKHPGVDLKGKVGDPVAAPITGSVEYLKEEGEKVVRVTGKEDGKKLSTRMLHVEFADKLIGSAKGVKEGENIQGVTIQDISDHPRWKGSDPHVHLEVYEVGKGEGGKDKRVDPMPYLRNEHKTTTPSD